MKILHFSSHFEDCGIAKYQENYLKEMEGLQGVENKFFDYSPYQTREMNNVEFEKVIKELRGELKDYQILHIQHEFGFYRRDQLEKIVDAAKHASVKIVVTYHTSPDLIIIRKPLTGLGPRSILSFMRSYRHNAILSKMHISPLLKADVVIAHNQYTASELQQYGVPVEKIIVVPHPTYDITNPKKTTFVADSLNKKNGDIILSTIGYIHRFKGIDKAIKALAYLPDNYKLAVLGGVKADSDDQALYDQLSDLIVERGFKDRVFITGAVQSDDDLNSYIRETDISLYPYDSVYYKGVASGGLNLAIANERPVVAYPVSTFKETNNDFGQLVLTHSDSYYELAREVKKLDIKKQTEKIVAYAQANSWKTMSKRLIEIYESLL